MAATSNMVGVTLCDTLSQVPPSKEETAWSVQRRVFPCMSSCRSNKERKKEKRKRETKERTEYLMRLVST